MNRARVNPCWYIIVTMPMSQSQFFIPLYLTPLLGGPRWNIAIRLVFKKLNGVANRWWERFDDMFSHFDRLLACNRQTDGQRDIFRGA